jgi:ribonucleoside-diphosphate reductase alpha chain
MVAIEDKGAVAKEQVEQLGVVGIPKETLDFFKGDEIRARVFYEKYALKDEAGEPLEKLPSEMWDRIARAIAAAESDEGRRADWSEKFNWLMQDFRFIPGGRIMFGAGARKKATLLNCYVIPIKEDSIEAIFDWCKESARTYSYGGGVGGDISVLRPKGAPVNNSAMHSTGAVSFMGIMSETTHAIGQAGRRGALMITLSVDHPDIFDFIRVKQNATSVKYANISVRVTDEFMQAVEADGDFTLRFGNGVVRKVERTVKARALWNELIQSARDWAEPGLMFWDTIKKNSPSEYNGMEVITTNPCSEQPLQAYGACDLGALNLPVFVMDSFTDNARMDWASLEKAVRYSVRFLDNVLDYNADKHPLAAQKEAVGKSRRIGLGVTGLADMLAKLRLKYDSEEALQFADRLFETIKNTAYDESTEIAKEKGPFPLFDRDKHLSMSFVQKLGDPIKDKIAKNGLRNVALLTVAPVGSGSVLAGTSSGIEPIFAFNYTRRSESLSKEYFKVYHPLVLEYMGISGLMDDTKLPEFFVPAHKINADFRVRMQGTIQRHVDSAISSTVNLPADTTTEQVGAIYLSAWKAGCKGITVYREGSRQAVMMTEEKEKAKEEKPAQSAPEDKWKRPQALIGKTVKLKIQRESLYVTSNFDETARIREVFINMGNTGSQEKSYTEAIGKLISEYLQLNGGDINVVIESLKGIRATDSISWDRGLKLYSVPDAIAKALEITLGKINFKTTPLTEHVKESGDGQQLGVAASSTEAKEVKPSKCSECGENMLVYESGCYTCKNCGYTKCS